MPVLYIFGLAVGLKVLAVFIGWGIGGIPATFWGAGIGIPISDTI